MDEFDTFIEAVMDKQESYVAFTTLYWTGIRSGELLALNRADFDTEKKTILISKSYQRFDKRDVITEPKTAKSKRVVSIPKFLTADYEDFFSKLYKLKKEIGFLGLQRVISHVK